MLGIVGQKPKFLENNAACDLPFWIPFQVNYVEKPKNIWSKVFQKDLTEQ